MVRRLTPNEAKILQLTAENHTLKHDLAEARRMVSKDTMTGLASRSRILEEIEHHLGIFRREQMTGESPGHFSILFIDLDDLGPVNKNQGHLVGDELIRAFGGYLEASIRPGDIAGRTGGDEFVVLAIGMTKEESHKLASRIVDGLASFPIEVSGQVHRLSASIGSASTSEGHVTTRELLHTADMRMSARKKKKKSSGR